MTEKTKKFSDAMGNIGDRYIEDAAEYSVKKGSARLLWTATAAACLCIATVVGVAAMTVGERGDIDAGETGRNAILYGTDKVDGGGGNDAPERPAGVEGEIDVMKSIAVYPGYESFDNVAGATLCDISEEGAYAHELGRYLPDELPDGYMFEKASIYETEMKDGTKYHMLRVCYANEDIQMQTAPLTEEYEVPAPVCSEFVVFVMDYEPKSDRIYSPDELDEALYERLDGSTFIINVNGEVYVGISPYFLDHDDAAALVQSVSR